MQLLLHCIFQRGFWDFEEPLLGGVHTHCEVNLYLHPWQRLSGCLLQCLCLPCPLSRGSPDWHTYWDFSLFTQLFFDSQFEINFLWCWSFVCFDFGFFFYFHALRKLSKRAINSLLYIVNALKMAVNLSLKAVYKTAETHWWCCQDNEN